MMSFLAIVFGLFIGLFIWLFFNWMISIRMKKIPAVYVQPGFWYPIKYVIFRMALFLRKRQNEKNLKNKEANSGNAGTGMKSRNSVQEMEQVQELPESEPLAVDAVYFSGGNKDGVFLVAATARRQENIVQTLLYLKLPGIGLFEMPSLPDTWLKGEMSDEAYAAGGLVIKPVVAMESWSIAYKGSLRMCDSGETVLVEFDLVWRAKTKYFDFDTDFHPHTMADAIAREQWSRGYFDTLQKAHQTHYEQFGEITGLVKMEGYPDYSLDVQGIRDHSYGNVRDWKFFHRYAINYAYLEDGTAVCMGQICMPISLSRLVIGYVFLPDGSMSPVSSTDFELYDWGEDGSPPLQMAFTFVAGKSAYHLKCRVEESPVFYMGRDWDARIHERMCSYTVNGVPGWGISEWQYRNYNGKEMKTKPLQES